MAPETGPPIPERISVYEVILMMTEQMASFAWQKLGLQPGMNGKIERDLSEAKVAVDATASLASFLESQLDGEDKRRVQNLVRDLRINFVSHSQELPAEGQS